MNGNKSDILMIVGDRDMRPNDPGKRYNSLSDGSLNIRKVAASDAGKYFCNNEIAVELRVIPRGNVKLHQSGSASCLLSFQNHVSVLKVSFC